MSFFILSTDNAPSTFSGDARLSQKNLTRVTLEFTNNLRNHQLASIYLRLRRNYDTQQLIFISDSFALFSQLITCEMVA